MTIKVTENDVSLGTSMGDSLKCLGGIVEVIGDPNGPGGKIKVNSEEKAKAYVVATVWNERTRRHEERITPLRGSTTLGGGKEMVLVDHNFNLNEAVRLKLTGTIPPGAQPEVQKAPQPKYRAIIRMYRDYYDSQWGHDSVTEQTFHVQPGHQWYLDNDTFVNVTPDGSVEIVKTPQDPEGYNKVQTLIEGDYVIRKVVDQNGPLTIIIEPETIGENEEN